MAKRTSDTSANTKVTRVAKGSTHTMYHKDGSIWSRGQMLGGEMHGYWEFYRKDGTIMRSGSFDRGQRIGTWTTYDAAGKPIKVTEIKPGAKATPGAREARPRKPVVKSKSEVATQQTESPLLISACASIERVEPIERHETEGHSGGAGGAASESGKLEVTTPTDREVVIKRAFDAPRRLVWEAWTRPELLKKWLHGWDDWTLAVCEMDLRPGGAFRWVWRGPDGTEMGLRGVYREIVRPERIVHTEIFDEDWTGGETLVTLVLTEHAGRTTATMTVLYSSREARDGALKTGMTEGLEVGFARLDKVLASMGGAA